MKRQFVGKAVIRDGVLLLPPDTLPVDPPIEVDIFENIDDGRVLCWELVFAESSS